MTNKNLTNEESLKEIKRLMEFHFKSHTRDSVNEPNIVKFNDVTKPQDNNNNDYPSFDEYIDEVINEEDPEGKTKTTPQPQQKQVEPKQAPVAEKPIEAPKAEPVKVVDNSKYDEVKVLLDKQNAKTDELLAKLGDMENKLNSVDQVNAKVEKLASEVKEAMPPSYEEQLDMISKKSFPYNVKLSDYWKFDNEQEVEPKKYTLNPDDIKNVNDNEIKDTFATDLNKNAINKVR